MTDNQNLWKTGTRLLSHKIVLDEKTRNNKHELIGVDIETANLIQISRLINNFFFLKILTFRSYQKSIIRNTFFFTSN